MENPGLNWASEAQECFGGTPTKLQSNRTQGAKSQVFHKVHKRGSGNREAHEVVGTQKLSFPLFCFTNFLPEDTTWRAALFLCSFKNFNTQLSWLLHCAVETRHHQRSPADRWKSAGGSEQRCPATHRLRGQKYQPASCFQMGSFNLYPY